MSAWMVSRAHIDGLVHVGMKYRSHDDLRWAQFDPRTTDWQQQKYVELNRRTATYAGMVLVHENVRSLRHRYEDADASGMIPEWAATYEYEEPRHGMTIVEAFKAISCYEYQACECPDWDDSQALRFCNALRDRLISHLPGYDAAPWGWEREHDLAHA